MSKNITEGEKLLRQILDADGILGKTMRWWNGSKEFDFQSAEFDKDSIQSDDINSRNQIKDRMERMLQELQSPANFSGKPANDSKAVERGLSFILQLALNEENFKTFGSDIFLTFYDIATTAEEPLRKYALLRTEVMAQMWLQNYPSLHKSNRIEQNQNQKVNTTTTELSQTETIDSIAEKEDDDKEEEETVTSEEVLDFIMGIYALERVGISHNSKEDVRAAAAKYTLQDFFDIEADIFHSTHDLREPPLEWRDYTQLLTYSFYAEKTGIDIHVTFHSVVKLLPLYRPYKTYRNFKYSDAIFDSFADQLTMIFNVIHVLSNYGELKLSAGLLPQETAFLSDPVNIDQAISFNDVHLVGEICHCLRVLGLPPANPILTKGNVFLRKKQLSNGSWPARDNADDAYFRYHATMCAISSLNPQRFRGYGPSDPKLYNLLKSNIHSTKNSRTGGSMITGVKLMGPATFTNTEIISIDSFNSIKKLYETEVNVYSSDIFIIAKNIGDKRLYELLKNKQEDKNIDINTTPAAALSDNNNNGTHNNNEEKKRTTNKKQQSGSQSSTKFRLAGQKSDLCTLNENGTTNNKTTNKRKRGGESENDDDDDDSEWKPTNKNIS